MGYQSGLRNVAMLLHLILFSPAFTKRFGLTRRWQRVVLIAI
jgi:hypothetical protein